MSGTQPAPPPQYEYTSGPRQWLRKASLIVNDGSGKTLDLSQLRFTFKITQSELQSPNIAWIRVSNPAQTTIDLVRAEFKRVTLSAGYEEGNFGVIFDGEIKQTRRGRENATDTYLEIAAADGDVAYNRGTISVSLAAGATPRDIIDAVMRVLSQEPFGVTLGPLPIEMPAPRMPRGQVLFGMARDVLRRVAQLIDCEWSIQNRVLTFTPRRGYIEGEIVVLTAKTGLVGLPEQTQDGIMARCLLNPNIAPGRRVRLDNSSVQQARFDLSYTGETRNALLPSIASDGLYRVLVIDWTGDTRGQEWYSELTLVSLDPTGVFPLSQVARGRVLPNP
jgi:hypothetical protein